MINALSCYYCSTKLHGNHCNDPFLTNNNNYMKTFNSSYKACAKIILSNFYESIIIRGPRTECNSIHDNTGSLWCYYSNYCNNSERIILESRSLTLLIIVIFILLKLR